MTNEIQHPYLVVHSVIPFKKNFFAARTTLARDTAVRDVWHVPFLRKKWTCSIRDESTVRFPS